MNFDALPLEYLMVGMAGVILYLLYYVFTKDSEYNRNIHSVATVVEELNREIYYLKKKVTKEIGEKENSARSLSDEEIYQEIERSVYDMVQPLSLGLRQAKEAIHAINSQIDSRISMLESGVKQISIPSSVHGNDDEKILSLYKQGVSLDTISKELHISKPEVEFVLKINKIK
ncbi:MAG: hypothetical protein RBR59_04370 [Sulfurimonadaceae bacterium]|jgi:hypothetical protein|nr:hypothetical protein [Sulfurimonadaceae bacterium]